MIVRHPQTAGQRWADQLAALDDDTAAPTRREPITVARIVATALELTAADGFDRLTMRRLAAALETGPASLYAHVQNKAELDDLLIGALCARVTLPAPDPRRWQEQIVDVCAQLRDQFLLYPGISRAALASAPNSLDTLRISEGMLAILLAGGVTPQAAAWAIDAAYLYVGAYSLEASLRQAPGEGADTRELHRDETIARLQMLPTSRYPNTVAYASELTSGVGHERFEFTLGVLFQGVAPDASSSSSALAWWSEGRRQSEPGCGGKSAPREPG